MNEGKVSDVADACPNARFRFDLPHEGFPVSCFKILSPRLEVLSLEMFDASGNHLEWTEAWDNCINLRELYVFDSLRVEDIEMIFSKTKKHLNVSELGFCDDTGTKDAKKAMESFAKGTRCLERFIYYGPPLCGDIRMRFSKLSELRDRLLLWNIE